MVESPAFDDGEIYSEVLHPARVDLDLISVCVFRRA